MTVAVTDMAAAGGLAGIAGAFNVSSNKETATGYEKMGKVGGRMTTENYDRANKSGEYSVLVANRFMVQAQGSNVSMDELKAAVGAVGLDRLEGMAKG
jgi:predicted NAD/FAD-dependent oxidoreductase